MIAIQTSSAGFDKKWAAYCIEKGIQFKIVDCYRNDIIEQIKDCDALLWQFYQLSPKDFLMAKPLMTALEHGGVRVFPDHKTAWHFDDKIGQKYLLEKFGFPLAKTWVFYSKSEAISWALDVKYPVVFKLRCGSGSAGVKLVKRKRIALRLIDRAFGKGFRRYEKIAGMKERIRKYKAGQTGIIDILKGAGRFLIPIPLDKVAGHEKGYIYFQEYIDGNESDIRVIVIGDKAFAIKRIVRENDFRASGSGFILYDPDCIPVNCLALSFDIADKLEVQCIALDFVLKDNLPILLEISFGFSPAGYEKCQGYWDREMIFHNGIFNPYGWMIEDLLLDIRRSKDKNS